MHQENILKKFFLETWSTNTMDHELVAEVLKLRPKNVLDVGCGNNLYKPLIPNLIGFDIVNPAADFVCDILDFKTTEHFDVILCLGSINFGDAEDILPRLKKVRSWLAPSGRVFMRANPGVRWPEQPDLVIFPWTKESIHSLGEQAGLKVDGEISARETSKGLRYRFTYLEKA